MKEKSTELARQIAKLLDDKKAERITVLDIDKLTTLGDYFVIASGNSTTQVKALAAEIDEKLSAQGIQPKRIDGESSAMWILMDYYDVIVHIFYNETRDFYGLERLWADAEEVQL
jgi:ribosome-associated protein